MWTCLLSKELRSKVVYLRYYERTTNGKQSAGNKVPNVPLVDLKSRSTIGLRDFVLKSGRPLVVSSLCVSSRPFAAL